MEYSCFQNLPQLFACSTERIGGTSTGLYQSQNLCDYVNDIPENVAHNRLLFCQKNGINPEKLIFPRQTHDSKIAIIDKEFMALSAIDRTNALQNTDGLITNLTDVCIGINTADCVPLLIFDPVKNVIATIHAGWRGTLAKIGQKAISMMQTCYGSKAQNLIVAIGPSISPKNYQVGKELIPLFEQAGFPTDLIFSQQNSESCHLDLWEANRWQLEEIGLSENQIHISGICTFANFDRFFFLPGGSASIRGALPTV